MRCFTRLIVTVALVLLCALGAIAQTSNGTLAGVVTDSTGAAIVNAKVTATSVQTGDVRTATTNSVGAYRFESLLPGTYHVEATADRFSVIKLSGVQVAASIITSVNIQLKPGASSETVEVSAQAVQLQTESGEISDTIGATAVESLPIANLNAYSLATTLPGIVTGPANDFTNGTNFSVNGNRARSNNFLIEGQDNNDAGIAGQGMQPGNLEAIQEVSVMTNAYAAEFGHGGGSVNNLIFKSGTNNFHGSAWERFSSSAMDANDHGNNFNGVTKAKYHENVFGFALGGPIVKDKLFFFASYQWDKYRAALNGDPITVFTPAGIAQLKALLPSESAAQQAQINTLLQVYDNPELQGPFNPLTINDVPLGFDPNIAGFDRGTVQIGKMQREGIAANYESPELDLKGDYLITRNDTLNLRLIRTYYTTPYDIGNFSTQLPGFDTYQYGPAYNAGITYTHVFTPNLLNELRMSYGRIGFTFDWRPDTYSNPLVDNGNMPAVNIGGTYALTGWGPPSGTPQGRFHNTYQLQDSISWTTGRHTWKFGFDIADIRVVDTIPFSNYFGSIGYSDSSVNGEVYRGIANFIDGFSGSGSASQTFGSNLARAPIKSQNYFAQDTWKLRSNLTLTLGVRYEYNSPFANEIPYPAMNINDPAPANYPVRIEQKKDTNDWGPRVSFAYTPRIWTKLFGDNKTVVRGGFGTFYDHGFTNILDNNLSGAPNDVPATLTNKPVPATPRGRAGWSWAYAKPLLSPILNPYASVTSIQSNLRSPEIYQWNLSVERELGAGFFATVGYVGTRGAHLYGTDALNPYINDPNDPLFQSVCGGATYCRIFPDRGSIGIRDNTGDSIYHGLQADVLRKFSKGMEVRANYTWSHAIDDVSEVFTTGNYSTYPVVQYNVAGRGVYDRGPSTMDRRHRVAISYVYTVPNLPAAKFADNKALAVLGQIYTNWQISGTTSFQSGAPANVENGYWLGSYDWNWDGIGNDRPTLGNPKAPLDTYGVYEGSNVCDGPSYMNGDPCSPVDPSSVHWITGELFAAGAPKGMLGRNSFLTHGRQDWTFALAKSFKLGEGSQKLEYRMEMFNPFNHGNTRVPDLTLQTGSAYGDFADYRYTVEGNRSIRMWLKLSF
ncbi:MAG: TonB-dependent receptor [Terriglobia bacterium]|nr:TonB-dependent receptor [Terriglobia bacterium]